MERTSLFPGGPDSYRSSRYVRDDANQRFEVDSAFADNTMTVLYDSLD
jgi:hypothetical protein